MNVKIIGECRFTKDAVLKYLYSTGASFFRIFNFSGHELIPIYMYTEFQILIPL
jgi:hypothetical protein